MNGYRTLNPWRTFIKISRWGKVETYPLFNGKGIKFLQLSCTNLNFMVTTSSPFFQKPRKIFYYNRSCKFKYSYSFYAYAFVCFFKYVELRLNHNFWIHSYLNLGKYWISKRAIGGIGYIETIFSVTHLLDGVCRGSSKVLRPHKNIFFFLVLWRLKKWCARAIFIFIFYLFYKVKLRFSRRE